MGRLLAPRTLGGRSAGVGGAGRESSGARGPVGGGGGGYGHDFLMFPVGELPVVSSPCISLLCSGGRRL